MVSSGSAVSDTSSRGAVLRDFTGGLNNVSDLSAIADNELANADNYEVDATGALTSRPPFARYDNTKAISFTTVQRTNMCTNPSFEAGTTGWSTISGATLSLDNTKAAVGTQSGKFVTPGAVASEGAFFSMTPVLTPNGRYSASIQVWAPAGQTMFAQLRFNSAAAGQVQTNFVGTGGWQTVVMNGATAPAAPVSIQVLVRTSTQAAITFWADALIIEAAMIIGSYFDGATAATPTLFYAYTGTAGLSSSTQSGATLSTQLQMEFLGYFNRADGTSFLVFADVNGTYLYNPVNKTYTTMTTLVASGCAQYQNRLYLCSRTAAGGWWGETVANSGVYTFQSLAAGTTPMPKGDQIVLYKDRFWIAGWGNSDERTKVYLSDVTTTAGGDINNWPVTNFFYVSRGDGQWITKLYAGPNDLTIYRNASSYYFRFDTDPRLGILTKYEGNIGCDSKYSLASYQNYVYVLSNGALYQLVGYQFYRRNDPAKLEFRGATTAIPFSVNTALSIVGSRALVWFSGITYCYNLTTNVWTTWSSQLQPAIIRAIQRPEGYFGPETAYGVTGSGDPTKFGVLQFVDDYTFSNPEQIVCTIRTKAYDYGMPDRFKTLFWWTADVLMAGTGIGNMVPVTLTASAVTWDDMSTRTWDALNLGTWDNPTIKLPGVVTSQTSPSTTPERVSLKFRKKLRFRRGYYELTMTTDGTLATGPAHIFSLTTYVETRQKITKGVT